MKQTVTVAAVKKTKRGGYGRRLATVSFEVEVIDGFADERAIHAEGLRRLRELLPTLKIATEIINWTY